MVSTDYNFKVDCGPLQWKCQGNFEQDMESGKISKLLEFIETPTPETTSLAGKWEQTMQKCSVRFKRVWNLLFGDHNWYNEKRACAMIKHYVRHVPVSERTKEDSETLLLVYDKLAQLPESQRKGIRNIERTALEETQTFTHIVLAELKHKLNELLNTEEFAEFAEEAKKKAMEIAKCALIFTINTTATLLISSINPSLKPLAKLGQIAFVALVDKDAANALKAEKAIEESKNSKKQETKPTTRRRSQSVDDSSRGRTLERSPVARRSHSI